MASTLTWLDFSEADQRRAREIVQLFSQRESRDELGIGVVRDVFSNLLFPGTSVIQTRARYFLFVPWLFQIGAKRGRRDRDLLAWVNREERKLIETLRKGGDTAGLIGVEAGVGVKILPSTIYWGGLATYGITRWAGSMEQVAGATRRKVNDEEALTEIVERAGDAWDSEIPPPPPGFPGVDRLNFTLTASEAGWLKDRILATSEGSLLHWLVLNDASPSTITADGAQNWPWTESSVAGAPTSLITTLRHAENFSLVMHGAALIYNVMLAERAKALGLGTVESIDDYTTRLKKWQELVGNSELSRWRVQDFWSLMSEHHTGSLGRTRQFVDRWIDLVRDGSTTTRPRYAEAQQLVAQREREQKGARARLTNDRMMSNWTGASGADRLSYRWPQVIRMLRDMNGGKSISA